MWLVQEFQSAQAIIAFLLNREFLPTTTKVLLGGPTDLDQLEHKNVLVKPQNVLGLNRAQKLDQVDPTTSNVLMQIFGPIKEINFCLDKQFNVVIGEQATGKSTLAKCIYFFKDVITEMTHLLMGQPEKLAKMTAEQILQLYYVKAKKLFYLSFGRYCHSELTEISYQYIDDRLATISVVNGDIQFKYDDATEQEIKRILTWYLEKTLSGKVEDASIFSLRAVAVLIENLSLIHI